MITIDQPALDEQMRRFSQSVRGKAAFLGVATSRVLKAESNRLAQTLMRITPPHEKDAAKEKITKDVDKKMGLLGNPKDVEGDLSLPPPKCGRGETTWFLATKNVIMGVAKASDMRQASDNDVYKVYWNSVVTKHGRLNFGWRGKQKIIVIKRFIFGKRSIEALKKRLWGHLGRLKSGWAVGWKDTGSGTGIYRPPQWVLQHLEKGTPRGRSDTTMLNDPQMPAVVIANSAKGIGSPGMREIAYNALRLRMEAMPKRLAQIVKHPELLEKELTA